VARAINVGGIKGSQGRQPAAVKKEWFMKERLMNLHSMQSLFFLSMSQ
jgi:hypothetical protein